MSRCKVELLIALFVLCAPSLAVWAQQPPPPQALPKNFGQSPPPASKVQGPLITQLQPSNEPTFALTGGLTNGGTIALTWQPFAGATGYTIMRNNGAVAQVAANIQSYVDSAVRPYNTYAYVVRAIGATVSIPGRSLLLPIQSTPLSVYYPPPPPPPGFTSVFAGSQINLSWSTAPTATGYQITKGSQTIKVSGGATLTFADQVAGTADVQYSIQSIVHAFDGSDTLGPPSPVITVRVRPFNMLVIGDSVMWGQGLNDGAKFSTQIETFLHNILLGHLLIPYNFAHSGAILGNSDPTDRSRPTNATTVGGEVPESYPTVLNQALGIFPLLRVPPANLDFILMDGCANDVTMSSLLMPWTTDDAISAAANDSCNLQMAQDLVMLHGAYPNAKIVVTGYFPIIVADSDLTAVQALFAVLGGPPGIAGGADFKQKAVQHSATFFSHSTAGLQAAVTAANSKFGSTVVKLAIPTFNSNNSYAVSGTWLWLVPSPPTPPNMFDQVFWPRQAKCASMGFSMPGLCPAASAGHPNPQGAAAYAAAVTTALADFVPTWQSQFSSVQRAH